MPNIKLPDGNSISFEKKVTGLQIAEKISKSLLKQALVISVDGNLRDLNYEIDKDLLIFSEISIPLTSLSNFIFFPSGSVIFGI